MSSPAGRARPPGRHSTGLRPRCRSIRPTEWASTLPRPPRRAETASDRGDGGTHGSGARGPTAAATPPVRRTVRSPAARTTRRSPSSKPGFRANRRRTSPAPGRTPKAARAESVRGRRQTPRPVRPAPVPPGRTCPRTPRRTAAADRRPALVRSAAACHPGNPWPPAESPVRRRRGGPVRPGSTNWSCGSGGPLREIPRPRFRRPWKEWRPAAGGRPGPRFDRSWPPAPRGHSPGGARTPASDLPPAPPPRADGRTRPRRRDVRSPPAGPPAGCIPP